MRLFETGQACASNMRSHTSEPVGREDAKSSCLRGPARLTVFRAVGRAGQGAYQGLHGRECRPHEKGLVASRN